MFFIKFVLLTCFVSPSMLAETKINWLPVWDDIEGNIEFVHPEEGALQNCDAPNGLGLKNLYRQIVKILPKEQIKNIIKSYEEDSQVKALRAFTRKPETQEKLKAIRNSPDYQILKNYTCRVLHIDLQQYIVLSRSLINPLDTRASLNERQGIHGLIKAVDEVLPYQKIQNLCENLLATDEELVKAVKNLKSKEFQQLLLNVRNNVPAYKELSKEIRDLGVPVEGMREFFGKALMFTGFSEVTAFVFFLFELFYLLLHFIYE